jgi:hypothetical protein
MIWEYLRKEVADKRLDAFLTEKGAEGWDLAYVRRGKETRVNRDPDFWEVIFKRPRESSPPSGPAQPVPPTAEESAR